LFNLPAAQAFSLTKSLLAVCVVASMVACGGGGAKGPATTPPPTTVTGVQPASVKARFDKSQVNSDAKTPVTVTALVRDVNQNALKDQTVTFTTTDPGVTLTVLVDKTDSTGKATATVLPDVDPTNRIITVTATAGSLSDVVQVTVVGTTLTMSGANSIVNGNSTPLTLLLKNSAGETLGNRPISLSSGKNSLAAATGTSCTGSGSAITCTTDVNGQVTVNFNAIVAGSDSVTASALGATATQTITVSGDNFVFTAPSPGAKPDVALGTSQTISVKYIVGGVIQAGAPITFSTTRGTLSDPSATPTSGTSITKVTDGSGIATVSVTSASQVGEATITASAAGGSPSAQGKVEFISNQPFAVSLQSSPATLSVSRTGTPASQSEIIALVRDAANNPVKSVDVTFNIVVDGSGAGSSIGQTAKTNSFGQASVFYTAGFSPSGQDGVQIQASIAKSGGGTAAASTSLTVTGTVFIITGFDNLIGISPSSSTVYEKEFVDIVTNSASNPVANQVITVQMQPTFYYKGHYSLGSDKKWHQIVNATCINEDTNNNGAFDGAETDVNGNGRIDPRFPGTLTGTTGAGGNTTTTTDSVGVAKFKLNYPKNYATWIDMKIISKTVVGGSESSAEVTLNLPVLSSELGTEDIAPSNISSPFGDAADCTDPN
jgi:predicted small lipoprotein YifL